MASELFSIGLEAYQLIVQGLIYICIVITFFQSKGNKRIYFLFVLAGYILITIYIQNFFLSSTLMTSWFIFSGIDFFVSKEILFVLLLSMVFLGPSSPFFYIIALTLYTITLANFILSSFKMLNKENSFPKTYG